MRALHVTPVPERGPQPHGRTFLPGEYQVTTQADVIGSTRNVPSVANVDMSRYIDQNTGGSTGVSNPLGYTIGMQKWRSPSMSGTTVVFPRTDISENVGPVGTSNWQGRLRSGVDSLFATAPTLEEIYASMVGG